MALNKLGISKMSTFNAAVHYWANVSPWESKTPFLVIDPTEKIWNGNKNSCSGKCIAVWFKVESEKREQFKCSKLEIWLCKLRYAHVIEYYAAIEVKYGNSYWQE